MSNQTQQLKQGRSSGGGDHSSPCVPGSTSFSDCLQPRSPTSAQQIGQMVLAFSKRSTIHGLNHIAQARSARRRIFWMLIFSAASCGFLTNLYHIAVKYIQVPVLTNVKHDHLSFKFPDITVCNINPIFFPPKNSQHYEDLLRVIKQYDQDKKIYKQRAAKLKNWKRGVFTSVIKGVYISDYLYMQRNITLYSIPHEIFVQDCRYMGTHKDSCSSSWITHRRWPYGACYQLNITKLGRDAISRSNKKAFSSGFRPDLFLLLYKGVEYPDEFKYLDAHGLIGMPSGVLLMLHEPGTYPQIGESFLLDKYAQVDLHMTRKQHLRKLKLCESHRDIYDYVDVETGERRFYKETRTDCVENITQTAIKQQCKCVGHEYPLKYDDEKYPFCRDFKWFDQHFNDSDCANRMHRQVKEANPLKMCYKDLCEHTTYSTVISQANFPAVIERKTHRGWLRLLSMMERDELKKYGTTDLASKALKLNSTTEPMNISEVLTNGQFELLNVDFVERNFMYLRIVPSSLFADEMLEDEEYPLSRFLTDVGGCVGLWVGASLITVFEFCDLLLDFLGLDAIFRRKRSVRQNGHYYGQLRRALSPHEEVTRLVEYNRRTPLPPPPSPQVTRNSPADINSAEVGQDDEAGSNSVATAAAAAATENRLNSGITMSASTLSCSSAGGDPVKRPRAVQIGMVSSV
ncbi:hypothetical protein BOX15_Mlig015178g3 [Macrostomum lignano]|uniref:Amiloride-sensitive sodium channel n=1 Tax=Macrostomum lignano TaxID=282301 RepID=A0A267F654_9PLAT|nr:hypothetical protein BOX15_Mlig015178g1 [Macrostomum lignano]PAA77641.1 hypothetical protein BOX15_Mlig015178g3 [Macrostomum lignano]